MKTAKKKIKQKIGLHNEFTLKITEYETEACEKIKKQWEAKAYNVVLNQGLTRVRNAFIVNDGNGEHSRIARATTFFYNVSMDASLGGVIAYGSGDTTPAATDTVLATEISRKLTTGYASGMDFNNLYAWYTQYIVITPSEHIGSVFKEVGLASTYSPASRLGTRALIVDSEGSPLSITKTSTMQISIYSKLYFILDTISFANTDWVNGGSDLNALLKRFKDNSGLIVTGTSIGATKMIIRTGTNDTTIDAANDNDVETELYEYPRFVGTASGSYAAVWSIRLGTEVSNGKIKEIGLSNSTENMDESASYPILRSVMPVTGVYTGTTFTDIELETGDGTNDEFTLGETDEQAESWVWNEINETNPTVEVDGVAQTAGTDFTYNDTTGVITFESGSIPGSGEAVTASWSVPYIAKSNDYVLDVEFEITIGEGTVPS